MLRRDYWVVVSKPTEGTDQAAIDAHVREHIASLLELERDDVVFVSGPLLSGPGVSRGSGLTVLRADHEASARLIASGDPFVRAGLRTFEVHRWRITEGSVSTMVSLGAGTFEWH